MKRNLMHALQAWKAGSARKPLILRGVRQTGKTYLLKQFGRAHFAKMHYLNFEKQTDLTKLFDKDLDPTRLIQEISFLLKTSINIEQDLLIFDEIQECPRALTSLKYFCEDLPKMAVCGAGSLLGLHLNDGSYPVGKVETLHLYPLSFEEFLCGISDEQSADLIASYSLEKNAALSDPVHQHLWEKLKYYFITGGLPEVVSAFAAHQDNLFEAVKVVRQKQDELLNAYYADIAKHSGKVNAMHIHRAWREVPAQLIKAQDTSTSRFRFKGIIPGMNRYSQLVNVIDWLDCAELIIKIPVVNTIKQPLCAYTKNNLFKLMMFDVGILGAMVGLDPEHILKYDYGSYKGYFAENFVAQQLMAKYSKELFTWVENRSEIEFLLETQGKIIPIEVKSGAINRAHSLQKYIEKYQPEKSIILCGRNLGASTTPALLRLPLYMVSRVGEGRSC